MGTGRRCRGVAAAVVFGGGAAEVVVSTIQTSFEVALPYLGWYNRKALAKTLARLFARTKTLARLPKTLARHPKTLARVFVEAKTRVVTKGGR